MIALAALAALGGADWQPLALDKFRAPPAMFFCKGNEAGAGLFTVFLRHNREASVIEASRTPEQGEPVEIKDRLQNVTHRNSDDRVEIRMPLATEAASAEFVLILGEGTEKGTIAWTADGDTFSGTCTSAPVPLGRTE
ncbi:MAG: hypothetical protein U1D66_06255 [Erythrobacter sp.]|nr:hypothetical protein [Erythrobacter sp.]